MNDELFDALLLAFIAVGIRLFDGLVLSNATRDAVSHRPKQKFRENATDNGSFGESTHRPPAAIAVPDSSPQESGAFGSASRVLKMELFVEREAVCLMFE